MSKKLYVGNVAFNLTNEGLAEVFGTIGNIEESHIVRDRETGRSRGFAFVTYENDDDAMRAIERLDGFQLLERPLSVSEARERSDDLPRLKIVERKGTCSFCGKDKNLIGYEGTTTGACPGCIKALNYFIRQNSPDNRRR